MQVASQSTDQVQTTLPDEDNIKQKAMSLLGQYLASKKEQNAQTGLGTVPVTGMSNSYTITESSNAARSSVYALPVSENVTLKSEQYNDIIQKNDEILAPINNPFWIFARTSMCFL